MSYFFSPIFKNILLHQAAMFNSVHLVHHFFFTPMQRYCKNTKDSIAHVKHTD